MEGDRKWNPVTPTGFVGFALGVILLVAMIWRSERGFIPILDHANLLFHEAGHPLISLLSSGLDPYGGTLGQLAFPVIIAMGFWRKGQTISLAIAGLWFFENWLNIARYLADARAQVLPLVGGGDHDWTTILRRWDLLNYDTRIATAVRVVAWAGIASLFLWVVWRFIVDRKSGFSRSPSRETEPG